MPKKRINDPGFGVQNNIETPQWNQQLLSASAIFMGNPCADAPELLHRNLTS